MAAPALTTANAVAPAPIHPALRVEYRDSDHSYRLRNDCTACTATGRVPGKRDGTTKQCSKCKGEGVRRERVPSVSTILAELNKPALVPWAAKKAAEAVHERVVNATVADAMHWTTFADELYDLAKNAHRELADDAADIGTLVHDWITTAEDVLTATLPDDPQVRPACEAFVAWWRTAGYEMVAAERVVVDERERYAGRFDLLVRDRRGRLFILDIKTSGSVYVEHVLQLSAYATALRQEIRESIAGTVVVWCHKDGRPVRVVERSPREYRADFRVFAALLGIYEHRKSLGGALRALQKAADEEAAEAAALRDVDAFLAAS